MAYLNRELCLDPIPRGRLRWPTRIEIPLNIKQTAVNKVFCIRLATQHSIHDLISLTKECSTTKSSASLSVGRRSPAHSPLLLMLARIRFLAQLTPASCQLHFGHRTASTYREIYIRRRGGPLFCFSLHFDQVS